MEIGCFYNNIITGAREKGITEEEALELAARSGIKALDISYTTIEQKTAEAICKQVEKFGMHISSVYAFTSCPVSSEDAFKESLKKMKNAMREAVKVHSPWFMPVPQKGEDYSEEQHDVYVSGTRRLFAELAAYGKELGVQVIVENISRKDFPYATIEDISYLLDYTPNLDFAYDSGNFPLAGIDELEAIAILGKQTAYVHLKDLKMVKESNLIRDGVCYDCVELGGGYLKLKEVLAVLKKRGYKGTIVIEVNSPNALERVIKSAEFIASIL